MNAAIREYNAIQANETEQAICILLMERIREALPEAEGKIWHAHPVWFLDGNPIVGYSKCKAGISLLFWSGQSFTTKGLKPQGKFKAAEICYPDLSQIDYAALTEWLRESRDIQWDYKHLVKRKGVLERLK